MYEGLKNFFFVKYKNNQSHHQVKVEAGIF